MRRLLFLTAASLLLAACGDDKDKAEHPPAPVETLYNEAADKLDAKQYKDAAKAFDEVERQHPYSEWATRAEVMAGFSLYRAGGYDDAVSTLQRFVKLHPGHESTAYAYYLIALCYYEQISDVGRDQKITEQALSALTEVVKRFPETEYARDAKLKLDLTYDHLAGKEMQVGRYYLTRDEYLSAINRFRYVVENYQTTSHVPEALYRLVECYLKLGVTDEAQKYAAVLGNNFPDSSWYRDAYALMQNKNPTDQPVPGAENHKSWLNIF